MGLRALSFSPDGKLLAAVENRNENDLILGLGNLSCIRVFDIHVGQELFSQRCRNQLRHVAFSRDGRFILGSGGSPMREGFVKLWKVSEIVR